MQIDRPGSILVAAAALLLAACTGPDTLSDPATSFTATLTGGQEVPPVTTTAHGTATINTTTGAWEVDLIGLSGDATKAHIHTGAAGSNGSVAVTLCDDAGTPTCTDGTTATLSGTASYDDALIASMRTFGAYVNVHTAANAGGEVRGQIFGVY